MTSPPESARVVVVGAGIAGAGVAHHLAERGWDEIVVVDQGRLFQTGGSTSHAPGLIFQHNASRTMTRLAQWTVADLTALGAFHRSARSRSPRPTSTGPSSTAAGRGRAASAFDARLLDPREVAELLPLLDPGTIVGGLHVADDGIAKGVRAAQEDVPPRGDRSLRRLRGHGPCSSRAAAPPGCRPRAGRSAPSTWSSPRASGGARCRGWRPGSTCRSCRSSTSSPTRRRWPSWREDVRGRAPDPAPPGPRDVLPPGAPTPRDRQLRHEPRLADPERPAELAFTAGGLRLGARGAGPMLPALRDVEVARAFNGLMSFTPDGFPLLGESAAARGPVAGPGDLGHALGRLRARAGGAHDPRRRAASTSTSATRSASTPMDEHRATCAGAAPRATARCTTSCTRASRDEQARGLRTTPFYEREARTGRRVLRERRLGAPAVVRGQPRAADRRRVCPTTSGRRATGRPSCRPSTAPAASGWASSTSRRSPRSRSRVPGHWPSCSAWRRTTSTSRRA